MPDAWPNLFRPARLLSAVAVFQAERLRRRFGQEVARVFAQVNALLVAALRDAMLTISKHTGHASLTLRTGWVEVSEARSDWAPDPVHPLPTFAPPRRVPHGVTLVGRRSSGFLPLPAPARLQRNASPVGRLLRVKHPGHGRRTVTAAQQPWGADGCPICRKPVRAAP